jgi:hypothetical protein
MIVFRFLPLVLLFFAPGLSAQPPGEEDLGLIVERTLKDFPVPPQKHNRLFYLQRNKNTNTVVYEANLLANGKLNPKKPVSVYWIRYTEGNAIKELNWIQRWLAYGVDSEPAEDGTGNFIVTPVALKNRRLTISVGPDGRPAAYMKLNGQQARLTRIYAEASETSWLPTVKFVQLKGVSVTTGKDVFEYIVPKN